MSSTVVQYILLRTDLLKELGWSVGAVVAQACHASTAVLHLYKDDEHTTQYLNDLDNMHKVVLETNEHKQVPNTLICITVIHHCLLPYVNSKWAIKSILISLDKKADLMSDVPNEASLNKVAEKLKENSIAHKLWIEQPENIPTCLAIKPYPKEVVKKYVGKFKLLKLQMSSTD